MSGFKQTQTKKEEEEGGLGQTPPFTNLTKGAG